MNKPNDIKIEFDSFVALHVQLHNCLRQLISSGAWKSGSRIPPESQLSSSLGISRSTVRIALHQSELEGLIERVPGKGTFVAKLHSEPRHNSKLIAFVTCGFDNEYHLLLLNGAESEARAHGYRIIFSRIQEYQRDFEHEIEFLSRLREENVAGVVLWPHPDNSLPEEQIISNYQSIGLPIVCMDRDIKGVQYDCVTSDNYSGAYALMKHLVELGHQDIVFLTHRKTDLLPIQERFRAYQDVLLEAGFSPQSPWLIGESGKEISASEAIHASIEVKNTKIDEIKEYLSKKCPSAIFGVNDFIAILAFRAAKLLNLKVPDMLSIAGFDDIDLASYLDVPLTTVAQDPFMIGKRATQRLIERLEGYTGRSEYEYIPTQIRVRNSTAVPTVSERG